MIKGLPGGSKCAGGSAGSTITPGPYGYETFVKAWMTSCPIAAAQRDAFLNQVLGAIAEVEGHRPSVEGGILGVTSYEEDGFVGRITVAAGATADGVEIAVTVEEQRAR